MIFSPYRPKFIETNASHFLSQAFKINGASRNYDFLPALQEALIVALLKCGVESYFARIHSVITLRLIAEGDHELLPWLPVPWLPV
jgi:hypothetical protein